MTKKDMVLSHYGSVESVMDFLQRFDAWTKSLSSIESFDTYKGLQTFSSGYDIDCIRPLSFGYRLEIYLKDRAEKENDCVRGGDKIIFTYDANKNSLYVDEGQKSWKLRN